MRTGEVQFDYSSTHFANSHPDTEVHLQFPSQLVHYKDLEKTKRTTGRPLSMRFYGAIPCFFCFRTARVSFSCSKRASGRHRHATELFAVIDRDNNQQPQYNNFDIFWRSPPRSHFCVFFQPPSPLIKKSKPNPIRRETPCSARSADGSEVKSEWGSSGNGWEV